MLLLQFKILLVESVDTIDHGLDKLDLRVSQTVLVGDIVGVALKKIRNALEKWVQFAYCLLTSLAARLAAGTTGLKAESFAPFLQFVNRLLGPAREINVDGGTHASAQVGGARVDVSKLGGEQEVLAGFGLDGVTDGLDAPDFKDFNRKIEQNFHL